MSGWKDVRVLFQSRRRQVNLIKLVQAEQTPAGPQTYVPSLVTSFIGAISTRRIRDLLDYPVDAEGSSRLWAIVSEPQPRRRRRGGASEGEDGRRTPVDLKDYNVTTVFHVLVQFFAAFRPPLLVPSSKKPDMTHLNGIVSSPMSPRQMVQELEDYVTGFPRAHLETAGVLFRFLNDLTKRKSRVRNVADSTEEPMNRVLARQFAAPLFGKIAKSKKNAGRFQACVLRLIDSCATIFGAAAPQAAPAPAPAAASDSRKRRRRDGESRSERSAEARGERKRDRSSRSRRERPSGSRGDRQERPSESRRDRQERSSGSRGDRQERPSETRRDRQERPSESRGERSSGPNRAKKQLQEIQDEDLAVVDPEDIFGLEDEASEPSEDDLEITDQVEAMARRVGAKKVSVAVQDSLTLSSDEDDDFGDIDEALRQVRMSTQEQESPDETPQRQRRVRSKKARPNELPPRITVQKEEGGDGDAEAQAKKKKGMWLSERERILSVVLGRKSVRQRRKKIIEERKRLSPTSKAELPELDPARNILAGSGAESPESTASAPPDPLLPEPDPVILSAAHPSLVSLGAAPDPPPGVAPMVSPEEHIERVQKSESVTTPAQRKKRRTTRKQVVTDRIVSHPRRFRQADGGIPGRRKEWIPVTPHPGEVLPTGFEKELGDETTSSAASPERKNMGGRRSGRTRARPAKTVAVEARPPAEPKNASRMERHEGTGEPARVAAPRREVLSSRRPGQPSPYLNASAEVRQPSPARAPQVALHAFDFVDPSVDVHVAPVPLTQEIPEPAPQQVARVNVVVPAPVSQRPKSRDSEQDILSSARRVLDEEAAKTFRSEITEEMLSFQKRFGDDFRKSQAEAAVAQQSVLQQQQEQISALSQILTESQDSLAQMHQNFSNLERKNTELERINIGLQKRLVEMETKYEDFTNTAQLRNEKVRMRMSELQKQFKDATFELSAIKLRMTQQDSFRDGSRPRRFDYQPLKLDRTNPRGYIPGQYRYIPMTRLDSPSKLTREIHSPPRSRIGVGSVPTPHDYLSQRRASATTAPRAGSNEARSFLNYSTMRLGELKSEVDGFMKTRQ